MPDSSAPRSPPDPGSRWPALDAARRRDAAVRIAFRVGTATVGSVPRADLETLARFPALRIETEAVVLAAPAASRDAAWDAINRELHARGLLLGWRDEPYAVRATADGPPLAVVERAAARYFGLLTLGAHANGYVADARGRPAGLWIARRSPTKATDPGKLDNLVGGGVPHGQTPWQTLLREAGEEAGLAPSQVEAAVPGRVIELHRDVPEGVQHERLHAHDLRLPAAVVPLNRDGEVAGFECLPIEAALEVAASGAMTVDAELVTLDFALRHGLLRREEAQALAPRLEALCG